MRNSTLRHYIRAVLNESRSTTKILGITSSRNLKEDSAWKIRTVMPDDGDWSAFERIGREFVQRAKANFGGGTVELLLKDGTSVTVNLDDSDVVVIDNTATSLSKVINLKGTNSLTGVEKLVLLTSFVKDGQFSKPRTAKGQISSANPYIAEWAVSYVIGKGGSIAESDLQSYYNENVAIDPRLEKRIAGFSPDQKVEAFTNFSEMVKKSFAPFKREKIPVSLGTDLRPNDDVTGLVDIEFNHNEIDYTLHIKFDNRTRIAGIRRVPIVEPHQGAAAELNDALDLIRSKQPTKIETIMKPGPDRDAFYAAFTPDILEPIARKIKDIIFGDAGEAEKIFNAIINYTPTNEPDITVLSQPSDSMAEIIDKTIFVIEPNEKLTTRFFSVNADIGGNVISDVMEIELRKDKRAPQLHMSDGWDRFVDAINGPNTP